MDNFNIKTKMTEIIELTDNDETKFLMSVDNEWKEISQEEYNNILRGK